MTNTRAIHEDTQLTQEPPNKANYNHEVETSTWRCHPNNASNLAPSALEAAGPQSVVLIQGGHQYHPHIASPTMESAYVDARGASHTCRRSCTQHDVPPPRVPSNLPFNNLDLTRFATGRQGDTAHAKIAMRQEHHLQQ
jgi:hypothetical protein